MKPIRLVDDENAVFVSIAQGDYFDTHPTADGAQGVVFSCPCGGHSSLIWFANPLNAEVASARYTPAPRWKREGTTLADLTLSPSVHTKMPCGFHGFLRDGVVQ